MEAGHSNPDSPIRLTGDPAEAEYFILPLHWTCYLWNGKRDMAAAAEMAELADRYGKPLVIWFKGDLVPKIPFENYILFLPGGVRSTKKENHVACPVFIEDPQLKFGGSFRPKSEIPTVGFCGFAASNPLKTAWSVVNGLRLKAQENLGLGDYEEVPVLPSTFLRSRVLRSLSKSRAVKTDFVIRQEYTATKPNGSGVDGDERVSEFFANIYRTDYTLCMRGYGNWSYRFYQTLACGRIPVFVDTECVLPANDSIDWRKHCVWVSRAEVDRIPEIVADFHSGLSPADFLEMQKECRRVWEERSTLPGFMSDLPAYFAGARSVGQFGTTTNGQNWGQVEPGVKL